MVEDGKESIVFVQPDPARPVFERRRVAVAARFSDQYHLYPDPKGVQPGERVLVGGAVLLRDAFEDLPVPKKGE